MKCSDSASKAIIPGKKMPWRLYDENGQAQCDLIAMDGEVIEAGKPVTMVNLDSDAIERTITFIPTAVRPLLVPHILCGELAIDLPSIEKKKERVASGVPSQALRQHDPRSGRVPLPDVRRAARRQGVSSTE